MLLLFNLLFKNDFTFVIIRHGFNHVLSCLSNDVLIADVDFILIAATASCGSNVPIFKTLNSITENAIVLPVFNILPLNLLKVSGSHSQLMSLVSKLFFVANAQFVNLFLKVNLLLVTCRVCCVWWIRGRQGGKRSSQLTDVGDNI